MPSPGVGSEGGVSRGSGKSGWLVKQGGKHKNWKRRWFKIQDTHLFYYKNPDTIRPLGVVPLVGEDVTAVPESVTKRKWCFEIKLGNESKAMMDTSRDTFVMCAISHHEMNEWMTAIRRQCYADRGGGIFGCELHETIRREKRGEDAIPILVEKASNQLISGGGIGEVGIFRLAGLASRITELKEAFDKGEKPELDGEDHNVVAAILKLYLRELPEPVLLLENYAACIEAARLYQTDPTEALARMRDVIAKLPRVNRNLLRHLCVLLTKVQEQSEKNKMTLSNLAVVFGPNLVSNPQADLHEQMENETLVNQVVCMIVENYQTLCDGVTPASSSTSATTPSGTGRKESSTPSTRGELPLDMLKLVEGESSGDEVDEDFVEEDFANLSKGGRAAIERRPSKNIRGRVKSNASNGSGAGAGAGAGDGAGPSSLSASASSQLLDQMMDGVEGLMKKSSGSTSSGSSPVKSASGRTVAERQMSELDDILSEMNTEEDGGLSERKELAELYLKQKQLDLEKELRHQRDIKAAAEKRILEIQTELLKIQTAS